MLTNAGPANSTLSLAPSFAGLSKTVYLLPSGVFALLASVLVANLIHYPVEKSRCPGAHTRVLLLQRIGNTLKTRHEINLGSKISCKIRVLLDVWQTQRDVVTRCEVMPFGIFNPVLHRLTNLASFPHFKLGC